MQRPQLRFSVRMLMALVVFSAIAIAAHVLRQRADEYRKRAAHHARLEKGAIRAMEMRAESQQFDKKMLNETRKEHNETISSLKKSIGRYVANVEDFLPDHGPLDYWERQLAEEQEEIDLYVADAAHYGQLRRKYERLARYPWLPVAPDPPPVRPEDRASYWLKRGDYGRALEAYDELARLRTSSSRSVKAHDERAWIWATCPDARYRNGRRAVESATIACSRDGCVTPRYLDTLAAAYAEAGEFESAVRWEKDALNRARAGSPEWHSFRDRLALYERRTPYRDEPTVDATADR